MLGIRKATLRHGRRRRATLGFVVRLLVVVVVLLAASNQLMERLSASGAARIWRGLSVRPSWPVSGER